MEFRVLIDNNAREEFYRVFEDVTEYVPLPLSEQLSLDESLDMGMLKLNYTDYAEPFRPFTSVNITITDGETTRELYWFVSSDEVTEVIQSGKYNHSLMLIEQSKWLERFTGITKTNTLPINKDYESVVDYVPIMVKYGDTKEQLQIGNKKYTTADIAIEPFHTYYKSPYIDLNFLQVISFRNLFDSIYGTTPTPSPFRKFEIYADNQLYVSTTNETQIPSLFSAGGGNYELNYYYAEAGGEVCLSLTFAVIPKQEGEYSITDVVNNLLATFETIRDGELPRFTFNEEQALEYSTLKAPEFSLTGTLWECLSQIGNFIHSIPRLRNGVIYFDKLCSSEKTSIDLSDYCSNAIKFDIEQFATSIDSTVSNIVNVDEKSQGTITAPFEKGFKTVRAEMGVVQLTENNILIETKEPIEEIISVECGYISGNRYVGDITPYIFESAEYDALSSYESVFPLSKAYALKYTQGQKNITALNFKLPNAVSSVFEKYSIINIIAKKLGVSPSSISDSELLQLQFRVKYIPIVEMRVKQTKSDWNDITFVSNLDFNQSASKINSFAYGENMKGTIAKLGNPEVSKLYINNKLSQIPKVGDLFDDNYYISIVRVEYYKDFYRCELALSKNYNKLNEFVGINSQKRFYEISEKPAIVRNVVYEDYCIIGKEREIMPRGSLITGIGQRQLVGQLWGARDSTYPDAVDVVKCTSIYEGNVDGQTVLLPLNTLGVGNSIVFNFRFDDNYSAGNTRVDRHNSKLQNQVRYTDWQGRVDKFKLDFGVGSFDNSNYTKTVEQGNLLPKVDSTLGNVNAMFSTEDRPIIIKKDNREVINFTYQMHFVTSDKSYVIGTGFTRKNTFVTKERQGCKMYALDHYIDKFQRFIDITNATECEILDTSVDRIRLGDIPDGTKSWVIVNKDNELVLGRNLRNVDFEKFVYFYFTHNVE